MVIMAAGARRDMRIMAEVAEKKLSCAGKDISMGGVIGTLAMLLQCSQVGATIDLGSFPRPENVSLEKWLISFPSFGFLLTAKSADVAALKDIFNKHNITCEVIGEITADKKLTAIFGEETEIIF